MPSTKPGGPRAAVSGRYGKDRAATPRVREVAPYAPSASQLRDEQRFATIGQELGTRLGDNVLLPIPLRHFGEGFDRLGIALLARMLARADDELGIRT